MTKNGIEYDQKIHINKCEHWNMTEISHWQTLTIELDQKTDEYDQKNINEINLLRWRTWTGEYDRNNATS